MIINKTYVTVVFKTSGKEQQQSSKNGKPVWEVYDSPPPPHYCLEGVMWGVETLAEPLGCVIEETELLAAAH